MDSTPPRSSAPYSVRPRPRQPLRPPPVCTSSPQAAAPAASARCVRVAAKPDLHPEFHEAAKVYCNGEEVLSLGGTSTEYYVDLWSGNHPFYQGVTTAVVTATGEVDKFKSRYAGLDFLSDVATVNSPKKDAKK